METISKAHSNKVLDNFMKEFFDFETLLAAGFFTKDMRDDYNAQADRVCKYFGFKTLYEYGAMEARAHVSYQGKRPDGTPFVEEIRNIYL